MGTINDMLKKMQGFQSELQSFVQKPIPILPDGNDMIDKQCPKEGCEKLFKVNLDDWSTLVKDDVCFCPACRNNSPAADYLPSAQRSLLVKNVRKSIMDNWHHNIPMSQGLQTLYATNEFEVAIKCEKCEVRLLLEPLIFALDAVTTPLKEPLLPLLIN